MDEGQNVACTPLDFFFLAAGAGAWQDRAAAILIMLGGKCKWGGLGTGVLAAGTGVGTQAVTGIGTAG